MINKIKNNIFQLCFNKFGSCVYLIKLDKNILIDTSSSENKEELIQDLQELKIKPTEIDIVLITHQHWDHNSNLKLFPKAKTYDATNISDFQVSDFKVIKTPGHTPDSLCVLYEDVLFSGDTLFHNGGRGRTDLPGGNEQQIQESIKKLKEITYKILCPGHVD